jgi:hypothetical protein
MPIIPIKSKTDLPAAKVAIEKATILLGLPFQLIEVGILAHGAGRMTRLGKSCVNSEYR